MCTDKLIRALRWRDGVESGEIITRKGYQRDYMSFDSVSQKELDIICETANSFYKAIGSPLRIGNSMGELRPGYSPQTELPLN